MLSSTIRYALKNAPAPTPCIDQRHLRMMIYGMMRRRNWFASRQRSAIYDIKLDAALRVIGGIAQITVSVESWNPQSDRRRRRLVMNDVNEVRLLLRETKTKMGDARSPSNHGPMRLVPYGVSRIAHKKTRIENIWWAMRKQVHKEEFEPTRDFVDSSTAVGVGPLVG